MIRLKTQGIPALARKAPSGIHIASNIDILAALGPVHLADRRMLHVLTLNETDMLIDHHLVSIGTVDRCPCHAREIFRYALYDCASCIALVQNHPSGDPTPSRDESIAADQLQETAAIIEIPIIEHIIVAANGWYDFAEPDCTNTYKPGENLPF